MVIAFSGDLGAGKSTIAERISKELGIPRFYAGQFFRDIAEERGVTLVELCELSKKDESVDKATDAKVLEVAEKFKDFVVEGRVAWHFIPDSIKIYLKVDSQEGARRIFKHAEESDSRKKEDSERKTEKEVELSNKTRMSRDIDRYKQYYDVDISDMNNYDFVLDTTNLTPDEVFEKTLEYIKSDKRFNR